ncbi:hypothetical protein ACE6H2_020667 [Prunus campanulata]
MVFSENQIFKNLLLSLSSLSLFLATPPTPLVFQPTPPSSQPPPSTPTSPDRTGDSPATQPDVFPDQLLPWFRRKKPENPAGFDRISSAPFVVIRPPNRTS